MENACIERINGRLRDACLAVNSFLDRADARAPIEHWRRDYDTARPHSGLAGRTPSGFTREMAHLTPPPDP